MRVVQVVNFSCVVIRGIVVRSSLWLLRTGVCIRVLNALVIGERN